MSVCDRPAKRHRACETNGGQLPTAATLRNSSIIDIDSISQAFREISHEITCTLRKDLDPIAVNQEHDAIHGCGEASLDILFDRPSDVLRLAREKTYEWPFKDVPLCWLRLCEDASLLVASSLLRQCADSLCCKMDSHLAVKKVDNTITQVVEAIDHGIALSGQPKRTVLTKQCLQLLECFCVDDINSKLSSAYNIDQPGELVSDQEIIRHAALDMEAFQDHVNSSNTPVVMSDLLRDWSAINHWNKPAYLVEATMGGRRLALVEIGSSYADDAMRQELMSIKKFMDTYLLDPSARETGYIAQHDLLGHVQTLSNDITIPDLCYTSPPEAGLDADICSPRRNVWIGPKGTTSPFHTDPDSNLYCQVVGYKYFRLISRDQSHLMYARSSDEHGLDLSNQSQVSGFSFADRHELDTINKQFPLFAAAVYQETILGPGDCLYIPSRWWHFAESLSISIGVNFWWT